MTLRIKVGLIVFILFINNSLSREESKFRWSPGNQDDKLNNSIIRSNYSDSYYISSSRFLQNISRSSSPEIYSMTNVYKSTIPKTSRRLKTSEMLEIPEILDMSEIEELSEMLKIPKMPEVTEMLKISKVPKITKTTENGIVLMNRYDIDNKSLLFFKLCDKDYQGKLRIYLKDNDILGIKSELDVKTSKATNKEHLNVHSSLELLVKGVQLDKSSATLIRSNCTLILTAPKA
ncbi:uncharacterized protein CMU_011550 [Cryptosporidium muris RN66]|uniref:Uncharacterized protein n=1 Tax=Cryptosporidium muris (strain RN66) TaxID=441375 RepID=B6AJ14_CRYMR|nr:uncharacterized protein CMU_011550 [Cryptosporidium muris RN66]EEA08205.1 hypothetical protein CMU_011550 [Cryptosporidium muris RN66]|eukprot:XP_002142554.1 hypothetical protein [Cryptosporidium muris RN66]